MPQCSGGDPQRDRHEGKPPSEESADAVTRRGLLRTGITLSALAAAGGATAWTLLDKPQSPSDAPPALAGKYAVPTATASHPAPAKPTVSAAPSEAGQPLPMRYFGPSGNQNVYFTMDDGWFPSSRVLEIMKSESIPVTTFLIVDAARENLKYWRDFVDAGGRIENHTVSHPYLTRLSRGEAERQWAETQQTFRRWFGRTPSLGRPPYGAINDSVSIAARNAGLTMMVAWSAADNTGAVQTWDGQKLSAGEIALSHWDPGVSADLAQLVAAAHANGLTPAYLPETW